MTKTSTVPADRAPVMPMVLGGTTLVPAFSPAHAAVVLAAKQG